MSQPAQQPHSAEYFGSQRDFWWNADFLELMAKRLKLDQVHTVLDVGCGVGHWGQILSTVLPQTAHITGIDREADWVAKANAATEPLRERFCYQQSCADKLPFADNTFDLVTCQTVLIHLADPTAAVLEMRRVCKPGGLILAIEPNNIVQECIFDTLSIEKPASEIASQLEFCLQCEHGKRILGEGFESVGDLVPTFFRKAGLSDIRAYLSDKASPILPPYDTPECQAWLDAYKEWLAKDFIIWSKEDSLRYFLAAGGEEKQFEAKWQAHKAKQANVLEAVEKGLFETAGGAVFYLISGRK